MKNVHRMHRFPWLLIFVWLLVLPAVPVWGANLSISPAGEGAFVLQGVGMAGVAGMTITVSYDQSSLANPRVVQGSLASGGLFVANTNKPGVIVIGVVYTSPISRDGDIATITFNQRGATSGKIPSISANFVNESGAKIDVATSASPSPVTTTDSSGQQGSSPTQPPAGAGQTPPPSGAPQLLGTVTMPTDEQVAGGEKKQEAAKVGEAQPELPPTATAPPTPSETFETAKVEPEAKKPTEKKYVTYQSVLERFRLFPGKQTPESLLSLLTTIADQSYAQEPKIVLTDGETNLQLTVRLAGGGEKEAPNFALNNATMVSLKRTEDGTGWIIRLLPKKGVHEASLMISHENIITQIPLTVAPPLTGSQLKELNGLTMPSFDKFLKERGTKQVPGHDLNGDGKRDYLDDYIYAANYLIAKGKSEVAPKGAK